MENDKNLNKNTNLHNNKKSSKFKIFVKLFCIFFILSNLFLYLSERRKYTNDIYPQAREYFVINDMIFVYRYILNTFVEVDNLIMQPLNKLQKYFYGKGIKYIPENDAERAFWNSKFNLYPYIRKTYMPKAFNKNSFVSSEIHTQILDDIYQTIVDLDRYEFKDTNLVNMKYKILPSLIQYFRLYSYLYAGNDSRYAKQLYEIAIQDRHLSDKLNFLSNLLLRYIDEVNNSDFKKEIFNEEKGFLEVSYISMIKISQGYIYGKLLKKDLSCNDEIIKKYLDNLEFAYIGDRAFFKNHKNYSKMYYEVCKNPLSQEFIYKLDKTCNIKIEKCYPNEKFIDENIINKKTHIYF